MSFAWVFVGGAAYAVIAGLVALFETSHERAPLGVRLSPLATAAAGLWWAVEVWTSRPYNGLVLRGFFSTAAFFVAGLAFTVGFTGGLAVFSAIAQTRPRR